MSSSHAAWHVPARDTQRRVLRRSPIVQGLLARSRSAARPEPAGVAGAGTQNCVRPRPADLNSVASRTSHECAEGEPCRAASQTHVGGSPARMTATRVARRQRVRSPDRLGGSAGHGARSRPRVRRLPSSRVGCTGTPRRRGSSPRSPLHGRRPLSPPAVVRAARTRRRMGSLQRRSVLHRSSRGRTPSVDRPPAARVTLLDGFRLDGQGLDQCSPRGGLPPGVQRLVAHLCLSGRVTRTATAGRLWPGVSEGHAHGSLR
jgi:hypothetical protein